MGPDTFAWMFDCFRLGLIVIPSILLFVITILLIRTIKTSDSQKLRFVLASTEIKGEPQRESTQAR
ncbi:hypothetical protein OESDEN_19106 [Oesophagostomum dentatum]|uniref:Uncharacterized protein n=1 Tax=Oesophagostomum dentatum TaxID=61180 RepID=A0A0B1S7E4_OESDE|nr:hypothetical protein OESDEN_19106 [Oesophagostomum dentatum]